MRDDLREKQLFKGGMLKNMVKGTPLGLPCLYFSSHSVALVFRFLCGKEAENWLLSKQATGGTRHTAVVAM